MARITLILAKSITEANDYARLAGLERFSYRAVRSAGAIKGVRNAEVHVLPTFTERLDRHAILAALQWARTLEVFYVDPEDLKTPLTEEELEAARLAAEAAEAERRAQETGTGPTEREIEVAYRYHALREAALAEPEPVAMPTIETPGAGLDEERIAVESPGAGTDAEKVAAPKQRQRKPRQPKPAAAPADFF